MHPETRDFNYNTVSDIFSTTSYSTSLKILYSIQYLKIFDQIPCKVERRRKEDYYQIREYFTAEQAFRKEAPNKLAEESVEERPGSF